MKKIDTIIWHQGHVTSLCGAQKGELCPALNPGYEIAPDCLCACESEKWPCDATIGTPIIKIDNQHLVTAEDIGL